MKRLVLGLVSATFFVPLFAEASYLIGTGIHDVTGPVAEAMMMGYVDPQQKTEGIHTRLWSRAYVIADGPTGNRLVFVSADLIHIYQGVKAAVIRNLASRYGDLYSESNVMLTATHTHSGPGGYSHYRLYTISALGYSQMGFDAVVDGITQSIIKAHDSLQPGQIRIAKGTLTGASRNRSPEAYLMNPAADRIDQPQTNEDMTLLRLERVDGTELGLIDWFAVHATSMQKRNKLISSDNKGMASYLFERAKDSRFTEGHPFVAAFANSDAGDVSPNTAGDLDSDGNWDCVYKDDFKCNLDSARRQSLRAAELYNDATELLQGPVDYRHSFVDMSKVEVASSFTGVGTEHTCPAAIGLSMLAGTADGRGIGQEGWTCRNVPLWGRIFCSRDHDDCHGVKPLALKTGYKSTPWTPEVLPIHVVRIGQLALIGVPAEFTTVSGRRLRATVENELKSAGVNYFVLAGYANAYAGYVATREEYQLQMYEGASTHFGEWTLNAYQQEFATVAAALRTGSPTDPGPQPRDLTGKIPSKSPPEVSVDTVPVGVSFGSVSQQPDREVQPGQVAKAVFWGGHPNNDLLRQSSFLEVQHFDKSTQSWIPVALDRDWDTRFRWESVKPHSSKITIEWDVSADYPAGEYRILHRGTRKLVSGKRTRYQGISRSFQVVH